MNLYPTYTFRVVHSGICSFQRLRSAHLGVHGSVEDLSISYPDDGGSWFGVVSMAGQVERVSSSQAHHRSSIDDRVLRRHYKPVHTHERVNTHDWQINYFQKCTDVGRETLFLRFTSCFRYDQYRVH